MLLTQSDQLMRHTLDIFLAMQPKIQTLQIQMRSFKPQQIYTIVFKRKNEPGLTLPMKLVSPPKSF